MPLRPQIKFLYLYVVCLGFLDGRPGWIYCRMQSMYEGMIAIKIGAGGSSGAADKG